MCQAKPWTFDKANLHRGQDEVLRRLLKVNSPEGETLQTERAYIRQVQTPKNKSRHPQNKFRHPKYKSRHPKYKSRQPKCKTDSLTSMNVYKFHKMHAPTFQGRVFSGQNKTAAGS